MRLVVGSSAEVCELRHAAYAGCRGVVRRRGRLGRDCEPQAARRRRTALFARPRSRSDVRGSGHEGRCDPCGCHRGREPNTMSVLLFLRADVDGGLNLTLVEVLALERMVGPLSDVVGLRAGMVCTDTGPVAANLPTRRLTTAQHVTTRPSTRPRQSLRLCGAIAHDPVVRPTRSVSPSRPLVRAVRVSTKRPPGAYEAADQSHAIRQGGRTAQRVAG